MAILDELFDKVDLLDQEGPSTFTVGLIATVVASVGFGCNLVPVKKVHTGDGKYFRWIIA